MEDRPRPGRDRLSTEDIGIHIRAPKRRTLMIESSLTQWRRRSRRNDAASICVQCDGSDFNGHDCHFLIRWKRMYARQSAIAPKNHFRTQEFVNSEKAHCKPPQGHPHKPHSSPLIITGIDTLSQSNFHTCPRHQSGPWVSHYV